MPAPPDQNSPYGDDQPGQMDSAKVQDAEQPRLSRSPRFAQALSPEDSSRATLDWKDLQVSVEDGNREKIVLQPMSGMATHGELVAVMGPSGAGKSCFLNALAGRHPGVQVRGEIAINGIITEPQDRREWAAYVMQEDALLITQTPREILHFSAALRLGIPAGADRDQLVGDTLDSLGLNKCADNPIGSQIDASDKKRVSGGEKKRTSIAQELLSRPSVIFLDEPTSGLDSWSAMNLIQMLRELAGAGCLVMCTIHQPSSEVFALFDRTILLSSGMLVYDGAVAELPAHLAKHGHQMPAHSNPADFVMLQLQQLSTDQLTAIRRLPTGVTHMRKQGTLPGRGALRAHCCVQMCYLMHRQLVHMIRERSALIARIGSTIFLNLVGGCIFFEAGKTWGDDSDPRDIAASIQNHFGSVFFLAINTMFLNAQPPLVAFLPERAVFIREYAGGSYGIVAYMMNKIILEIPVVAVSVGCGLLLMYFLAGLQGNWGLLYLNCLLFSFAASSLSFVLGVAAPDPETAVNMLPLLLVPQILFSGFFMSNDAMPKWIRWAQYLCTMKYHVNLQLLVEFDEDAVPDNRLVYTEALVDRTDVKDTTGAYIFYYGVLIGVSVLLRLVATVVLHFKAQKAFG